MSVCECMRVCVPPAARRVPLFHSAPITFSTPCFAESANVSEKPLDAEREKELRAEEVGTDDSDPASPSWALSSEDTILGIRSLPGSFPTESVGRGRGGGGWRSRPVSRLRFFFSFL